MMMTHKILNRDPKDKMMARKILNGDPTDEFLKAVCIVDDDATGIVPSTSTSTISTTTTSNAFVQTAGGRPTRALRGVSR